MGEPVLSEVDLALRTLPDQFDRSELLHHIAEEALLAKNLEIVLFETLLITEE